MLCQSQKPAFLFSGFSRQPKYLEIVRTSSDADEDGSTEMIMK